MEFLQVLLPIIIYILLIVLLIIGIILGLKFIRTMTKFEAVVDDVNEKVHKLDGFFHILDFTTDKIVSLTDKVVDGIALFINRIFTKKEKKRKEVD